MQSLWRVGLLSLIWVMAAAPSPAQNLIVDDSSKILIIESRWYDYSLASTYYHGFPLSDYFRHPYDDYYLRKETIDPNSQGLSNIYALPRGPEKQYIYQVRVRNAGEKEIIAIDWTYIFADRETDKTIASHSFRTQVRIRPRKSKTLSEISVSPPTRVISVRALEKNAERPFAERVIVNSISFF